MSSYYNGGTASETEPFLQERLTPSSSSIKGFFKGAARNPSALKGDIFIKVPNACERPRQKRVLSSHVF